MKTIAVLCLVLVAMVRGQGERVHVVDNANVDPGFYQPTAGGGGLYNVDQGFYQPSQPDSGFPMYNVDQGFYQPTYQEGSNFPLYNVDQGYYQPSQPDSGFILQNVDQAFYRPTVGNPPNGGYQQISTGPELVDTSAFQRPNRPYPYRPSVHPGARDGK